jgi:HEAT repeat protein
MISLLVLLLAQPVPEDSILKLFDQVAHPYLKYQDLKEPSREALVELGSEAARVLMTKMRSRNARELHGLEDVLEDIGEAALPHLHEATGDTCGRARRLAVRILGKIGSPASIPHILPFLDDTSWKARSVAVEALGDIGDPSTLDALLERARDPVEEVRGQAAHALSFFPGRRSHAMLFRLLSDDRARVRYAAFTSLEEMEDGPPVPHIARAALNGSGFGRALALRLLRSRPNHPLSKQTVLDGLRDPDWRIRVEAAQALQSFDLSTPDWAEIAFQAGRESDPLASLAMKELLKTR